MYFKYEYKWILNIYPDSKTYIIYYFIYFNKTKLFQYYSYIVKL